MCHIRRRDNLTAALHMVVESVFWFHPLVWWIGARLVEEREHACDEAVLRSLRDGHTYAEAILIVSKRYVEVPLVCVSGISVAGSVLKRRIRAILEDRAGLELSFVRKAVLLTASMTAMALPILIGVLNPTYIRAQDQAAEHLAFEVASVKLNTQMPLFAGAALAEKEAMLRAMALQYLPSGRFLARGIPIPFLIFEAYSVSPGSSRRITLSPELRKTMDPRAEWARYDIEAVAEKEAIPANASQQVRMQKMRLMLQTLLVDRFKLRVSHETKEVPVYALVVGKNGPRLQKSAMDDAQCAAKRDDKLQIARVGGGGDPAACHAFAGGQGPGLRGQAIDMSDLAQAIEVFADRPVVNRTDLNGLYKIDVPGWVPLGQDAIRSPGSEATAEERAFGDPSRPTLSDVLQGLGLRMEATKAQVDMFVVEYFERPGPD